MTESSADAHRELLANLRDLAGRVRAAQRGAWFPLLLLGALTLGAILVDRFTFSVHTATNCPPDPREPAGTVCTLVHTGSPIYWLLGLVLVYGATALFYIRRSSNRGVGTPVRPYIIAGIGLVVLVTATGFWGVRHMTPSDPVDFWGLHLDPSAGVTTFLQRFTGTAATVGLPLLVLSWVERSRALLLFTLAYLVIEMAPITNGRTGWAGIAPTSPWTTLPRLAIPGVFLLLGALGFALSQSPRHRTAS